MSALRHAAKPCSDCPWRRDVPAGQFPACRYDALRATAGSRGAEAGLSAPIFACHKSAEGKDIACAGWLAVVGAEHLGIRMAMVTGRIDAAALMLGEGWPELFSSYEEMAATQGVSVAANSGSSVVSRTTQ